MTAIHPDQRLRTPWGSPTQLVNHVCFSMDPEDTLINNCVSSSPPCQPPFVLPVPAAVHRKDAQGLLKEHTARQPAISIR